MVKVTKVPYYQIESSALPFTSPKWHGYTGTQGCVPLDTQKSVAMDRLAPGEPVPPAQPKPPKPTAEERKAEQAQIARKKLLAQQAKKQPQLKDKSQENLAAADAEECENPPVFDMLDIPDAMEKLKWPISAKLARKWFGSPKHIYDDNPVSIQPIDDTTVTLDWALKFGSVKDKFNKLLEKDIYSDNALKEAKRSVLKKIHEIFITQNSASLSFNTAPFIHDLRQFHIDWQFQLAFISDLDTVDGRAMTDLTGSLANFNIYMAIGNAVIHKEQYFKYDNEAQTKTFCIDPKVEITHVYVYIKDNYSFNDKAVSKKSQYLGHWNKTGFIVTKSGLFNRLVDSQYIYINSENSPSKNTGLNYLLNSVLDKPVDTRKGMINKFREQDVYFPIYNKSYNDWREKHNRGGDSMIYSKPKYIKFDLPPFPVPI